MNLLSDDTKFYIIYNWIQQWYIFVSHFEILLTNQYYEKVIESYIFTVDWCSWESNLILNTNFIFDDFVNEYECEKQN